MNLLVIVILILFGLFLEEKKGEEIFSWII